MHEQQNSMSKYLAASLTLLPLSLAISQQGGLFSSYASFSIELIGFPEFAGECANLTILTGTRCLLSKPGFGRMLTTDTSQEPERRGMCFPITS